MPCVLWADKPTAIPPGKWFRQVYEPKKINGSPMGAGALWYLNFGWLGLLLGGLLSGLVIGLVSAAQRRYPPERLQHRRGGGAGGLRAQPRMGR